jgi:uncharacterized protein
MSVNTTAERRSVDLKELSRRYLLLAAGIVIMAIGLVVIIKAHLGTSPISSLPYVMSLDFSSFTYGEFTFCWNILLIFAQIIVLKKNFRVIDLLQIPISVLFASSIDIITALLSWVAPGDILDSVGILLIGMFLLAVGVTLTVISNTVMNCAEAFVKAITIKTGWNFGHTKVVFDTVLVISAMVVSLFLLGDVEGVGLGTIAAALCTGFIVNFLMRFIAAPLRNWCVATK